MLVTEQGSKAVEEGLKQAMQSSEAIKVLADSTAEASQVAVQISASSQQQVVGMDQIGKAMENINLAGTQNVASVKQAEASAKSFHEMGQKLKQIVSQYKV